jgi:hypothetical protein
MLKEIAAMGRLQTANATVVLLFPCGVGTITLRFQRSGSGPSSPWLGLENITGTVTPREREEAWARFFATLSSITGEICVAAKSSDGPQVSTTFSTFEFVEILNGEFPNEENFPRIEDAIRRQQAARSGSLPLSGGGGYGGSAQGQTRKPGSHRDNRGHN